jgi:hypothetical protein
MAGGLASGVSPSSPTGSSLHIHSLAACGGAAADGAGLPNLEGLAGLPNMGGALSSSTKLSIQQALQGLERVNARWTRGSK